MTTTVQSSYSNEQIAAWLRGLLTIAWADGHFDPEEKELIAQLTQTELSPAIDLGDLEIITAEELATGLGEDKNTAENFLRTAVMMAIADGVYSTTEAKVINEFRKALGLEVAALASLETTLYDHETATYGDEDLAAEVSPPHPDVLKPIKEWLDDLDIKDPKVAKFICKMVPSQCPFERDIVLFGHKVVHIPPMCKLNPLYEQLVGLRFRSLSYLADECKEDISEFT